MTFERTCTDGDAHAAHRWSDGRRAWSCQGRAGHGEGQQELAEVVELSLAG